MAKITVFPSKPTTLAPTVNSPTPITVPVVMVMDSRRPRQRFKQGAGFDSSICIASFRKETAFSFYAERGKLDFAFLCRIGRKRQKPEADAAISNLKQAPLLLHISKDRHSSIEPRLSLLYCIIMAVPI